MNSIDWIAKRRELLDAVTEGPWRASLLDGVRHEDGSSSYRCGIYPGATQGPPPVFVTNGIDARDAAFIADARTSLPLALDALETVLTLHTHKDIYHLTGLVGSYNCLGCAHAGYGKCPTVRHIEATLNKEL